jgi:pimeloyl-ACP methyl ester carboxylesterase
MTTDSQGVGAVAAPNQFVEVGGRRLAYRSTGTGTPMVLCTRFRGNLDLWDPAFIDALSANGFRAITFDYSGLGLSTGEKSYDPLHLAKDAADLVEVLDLRDLVITGWSVGGMAAQVALTLFPDRISHVVLLATTPPGRLVKPAEQLFHDTAAKPHNDLDDEMALFFEPTSAASRHAAQRSAERIAGRSTGLSEPVPAVWAAEALGFKPRNPVLPSDELLALLQTTSIPVLHIGGDHDIAFPVENWYALNGQFPTLQLLTFPRAGHAPHHQHPRAAAEHIAAFVRTTTREDG